jgi:hypothetical protein
MKRNARLLNKTADRIEKIPESYAQDTFCRTDDRSPCGTVACLAGEIVICSARSVSKGIELLYESSGIADLAARKAGLDEDEASSLFWPTSSFWPQPFRSRYGKATTQRGRAKVAADLLRYLAKGGDVRIE